MNTRTAKAKGRRLQVQVRDSILQIFPELTLDDVRSTPASVPGEDIQLSPKARNLFPYSVECKNQERLNLWAAIDQAEKNSSGYIPLTIFKRNRSKTYVVLEWSEFLKIVSKIGDK